MFGKTLVELTFRNSQRSFDERQERSNVAIVTLTRIFKSVFRSLEVNSTPVRIRLGTGVGILELFAYSRDEADASC